LKRGLNASFNTYCHKLELVLANSVNTGIQSDWFAASDELCNQLQQLTSLDARVELFESLCFSLEPELYPAFLQLLFYVEHHADAQLQQQFTDTLVYAMGTGRLPCGTLPAWGSMSAATLAPYTTSRALGPIEFLCAWYAQPTHLPQLSDAVFDDALSTLMRLIDSNTAARKWYCHNLKMDAINDSIGMFSSATRTAIAALAKAWNANGCSDTLAAQFIVDIKNSHTFKSARHLRR